MERAVKRISLLLSEIRSEIVQSNLVSVGKSKSKSWYSEKSVWTPVQKLQWLGISCDLPNATLSIPQPHIDRPRLLALNIFKHKLPQPPLVLFCLREGRGTRPQAKQGWVWIIFSSMESALDSNGRELYPWSSTRLRLLKRLFRVKRSNPIRHCACTLVASSRSMKSAYLSRDVLP